MDIAARIDARRLEEKLDRIIELLECLLKQKGIPVLGYSERGKPQIDHRNRRPGGPGPSHPH